MQVNAILLLQNTIYQCNFKTTVNELIQLVYRLENDEVSEAIAFIEISRMLTNDMNLAPMVRLLFVNYPENIINHCLIETQHPSLTTLSSETLIELKDKLSDKILLALKDDKLNDVAFAFLNDNSPKFELFINNVNKQFWNRVIGDDATFNYLKKIEPPQLLLEQISLLSTKPLKIHSLFDDWAFKHSMNFVKDYKHSKEYSHSLMAADFLKNNTKLPQNLPIKFINNIIEHYEGEPEFLYNELYNIGKTSIITEHPKYKNLYLPIQANNTEIQAFRL